jgi:hypothetical protein
MLPVEEFEQNLLIWKNVIVLTTDVVFGNGSVTNTGPVILSVRKN